MSTAGKVLVVSIMLASIVWLVLMAGVTELNRNGNRTLNELNAKVEKLVEDVQTTQADITKTRDQTTLMHEQIDHDLAVLHGRQTDVERVNSNIKEMQSRVQHQLATLGETIKNAEQAAKERGNERAAEQKALDDKKAEVEALKAQNSELMNRLTGLRNEFKTTRESNVDMLGKTVK
jgi:chromosome segregation ATPase